LLIEFLDHEGVSWANCSSYAIVDNFSRGEGGFGMVEIVGSLGGEVVFVYLVETS
jgi:hypothetical protein